jgi:hypothetical protein
MKWILILISYWDGNILTVGDGVFENHIECFEAREKLGKEMSGESGYFPVNLQAICMRIDDA